MTRKAKKTSRTLPPKQGKGVPQTLDEMIAARIPDLRVDFNLVEYGYEVIMYRDGKKLGFECRDFGGNHKIDDLVNDLLRRMGRLLRQFREAH